MKEIYLIRHCEAEGQAPDAPLTERGFQQAAELVSFFSDKAISQIIASPYLRAVQTVEPLAKELGIQVKKEELLVERRLSDKNLDDWMDKLQTTFEDLDISFEGGESSREATARILEVIEGLPEDGGASVIVTHGNLLSLLLTQFDQSFGFEGWKNLSNPDVYHLKVFGGEANFKRVWK